MRTKFRNSTGWSDAFLKAMYRWATKVAGIDRPLRQVQFTKCRGHYRGRAWNSGRILVRVGPGPWPHNASWRRSYKPQDGSDDIILADAIEALVHITGHELGHIRDFRRGAGVSEVSADSRGRMVLRLFRENRDALLAAWSVKEKPARKTPTAGKSIQEKRAEKTQSMLAAWERKLKLAKTKVATYRRKAKYYERALAAKSAASQ
jgi:hypothetical protein